jgi:hypothetical protein
MDSLRSLIYNSVPMTNVSMIRPVVILICGMLLFNLPIVIYKMHLTCISLLYLCFCWDKSYKKPKIDPSIGFVETNKKDTTGTGLSSNNTSSSNTIIRKKTIYFVRHGESTWNDTFNKGKHRSIIIFIIGFIPNLIKAIFYELYLLLSGKMDR